MPGDSKLSWVFLLQWVSMQCLQLKTTGVRTGFLVCQHLPRTAGSDEFDKLSKICQFLEDLKTNFKLQYNPHCDQGVDEAMVKYKGRTSLKQYMPMKPIKRGIKLWCPVDSTSGYLRDFDVYTGKQPGEVQHGLGYTVVSNLCQHIKGKWYSVFF